MPASVLGLDTEYEHLKSSFASALYETLWLILIVRSAKSTSSQRVIRNFTLSQLRKNSSN